MHRSLMDQLMKLAFLITVLCSWNSPLCEAGTDTSRIKTVLFKITSPDSQHISYLFGTHHVFGKTFFDSLQNARDALLSSDVLIKENLNFPGRLAEDIINKRTSHTPWSKYLKKEDLRFARSVFANSSVNFDKVTPTELHVLLSRFYKEKICLTIESRKYLTLDDYIGTLARENKMDLIGLETAEEQLEIIRKDVEGMPRKVHRKRIARLIDQIKSGGKEGCSEIRWYSSMDFDYKFSEPCHNTLVLTDRNNRWMVRIVEYLKTKDCFIAVGLSHLMFECGLISQLRALGYSVTAVEV